jgi:hypothetical protein
MVSMRFLSLLLSYFVKVRGFENSLPYDLMISAYIHASLEEAGKLSVLISGSTCL